MGAVGGMVIQQTTTTIDGSGEGVLAAADGNGKNGPTAVGEGDSRASELHWRILKQNYFIKIIFVS